MEVVHNPCRAQPAAVGCVRLFVDSSTSLDASYCASGDKQHAAKTTGRQPKHLSTQHDSLKSTFPSGTVKGLNSRATQDRLDEKKGTQLSKLQQWQQQRSASLQQLEHQQSSNHAWYRSSPASQVRLDRHQRRGRKCTQLNSRQLPMI